MPDTPDGFGDIAGMYSIADWAAYEGKQIAVYDSGTLKDWGEYTDIERTVAAGKKLFITDLGGTNHAGYAADAQKQQAFSIHLTNSTTGDTYIYTGGNIGIHIKFTPPVIISAAERVYSEIFNRANHPCNQRLYFLGFEIDV